MGRGDWLDVKPEAAPKDVMRSSDFDRSQRMSRVTRSDVCVSAAQGCPTLRNAKRYISLQSLPCSTGKIRDAFSLGFLQNPNKIKKKN